MIIYTAITNNYDEIKVPSKGVSHASYYLFAEGPFVGMEVTWKKQVCTLFDNPCLNAKMHKILPHRFFPYAEYSLWIDGSIEILPDAVDLENLIDTYLKDADICVFKHPHRDCLYKEAALCAETGRGDEKVIKSQTAYYQYKNFPSNFGLYECGVILRRHTTEINVFNELWWSHILTNSYRDQISFPYMLWLSDLKLSTFPGALSGNNNDLFKVHAHNEK